MVEKRIFVFFGSDYLSKKNKISAIQSSLASFGIQPHNTFVLYCPDLSQNTACFDFDTIGFAPRLFIFKNFQLCPEDLKKHLCEHSLRVNREDYFFFDYDLDLIQESSLREDCLFQKILEQAVVYRFGRSNRVYSLFQGFAYAFKRRNLEGCLFYLEELFIPASRKEQEEIALKVIGYLTKNIPLGVTRGGLSHTYYLWWADRALKETNLPARSVLSALLCRMLNGSS